MSMEPKKNERIREFHYQLKPPHGFDDAVLARLKQEQLISINISMNRNTIYWMAAAVVGIVLGFFIGQYTSPSGQPSVVANDESQYLLLLYEDSTFTTGGKEIGVLIKEYTDWAVSMSEEGHLVGAEKLASQSYPLGNIPETSIGLTSGYFVIKASTLEKAMELTKTHPHLTYNGGIELRPIEKLN